MIFVDRHHIDYPDDNISRRFREWITSSEGRAFEHEFINVAVELHKQNRKRKVSGYAIGQWVRALTGIKFTNDYGPILARLAVAKHPPLGKMLAFKLTGWGRRRQT